MTIKIHSREPVGRFEDVYPRAPFSELIRLALVAAEAVARRRRRVERSADVGRPAVAA